MTKLCVAVSALIIAATASVAQQAVEPPPRPDDSGPSLDVTLKFIQDKIKNTGKVNWVVYCHNNVNGDDITGLFSREKMNVATDASMCRVSYHRKEIRDDQTQVDQDFWVNLRNAKVIQVWSGDEMQRRIEAGSGHPEISCRLDPPVWIVRVDDLQDEFYFYDEDLANRVAKAMLHAVELCGGGNHDPF
ncbi:MAG: hypothetical protein ABSG62_24200 [Terracidiphilus sp.]|jgi:hypothetical protein